MEIKNTMQGSCIVVKALADGVGMAIGGNPPKVEKLNNGELYITQLDLGQTLKITGSARVYTPYGAFETTA